MIEMFKYKVSIYLKGGQIVYVRFNEKSLDQFKNEYADYITYKTHKIYSLLKECELIGDYSDIALLRTRKWWQRWG